MSRHLRKQGRSLSSGACGLRQSDAAFCEGQGEDQDPSVLVGSCGGVVVLRESELAFYNRGYRRVLVIALTLAAVAVLIVMSTDL